MNEQSGVPRPERATLESAFRTGWWVWVLCTAAFPLIPFAPWLPWLPWIPIALMVPLACRVAWLGVALLAERAAATRVIGANLIVFFALMPLGVAYLIVVLSASARWS